MRKEAKKACKSKLNLYLIRFDTIFFFFIFNVHLDLFYFHIFIIISIVVYSLSYKAVGIVTFIIHYFVYKMKINSQLF